MGLCGSKNAVDDHNDAPVKVAPASDKQPQQQQVEPKPEPQQQQQQPNSARSSTTQAAQMDEEEYRAQIKSIFLFIFDRLVQTMEYERDSMHQLALLRDPSKSGDRLSYLNLFGGDRVESWMRSVFDLSHVSMPAKGAAAVDGVAAEQNFRLLITGAQQVAEGGPKVSRADITASVKEVCAATQASLQASQKLLEQHRASFPRYADLSAHFVFFLRCLNFTQGDIANDAAVLAKNVEDITSAA